MTVTISSHNPTRLDAIKTAAKAVWPFDEWDDDGGDEGEDPTSSATEVLCGGESEKEFIERLSVAVWGANGAFCDVTVDATCLEYAPCETYCLDEADYGRLIIAPAQAAKDASATKGGRSSGPVMRRRITSLPPASVPPVDVERVAQALGLRIPSVNLNLDAPTKREVRSAVQEALAEVEEEIRQRQRQYDLV